MFIQIPKVKEFVTGPQIANYANPLVLMFDVLGVPYMFICYGLNCVYAIFIKLYDNSISNSNLSFNPEPAFQGGQLLNRNILQDQR